MGHLLAGFSINFHLDAHQLRAMLGIKLAIVTAAQLTRMFEAFVHFGANDAAASVHVQEIRRRMSNHQTFARTVREMGRALCTSLHTPATPANAAAAGTEARLVPGNRMASVLTSKRVTTVDLDGEAATRVRTANDDRHIHAPMKLPATHHCVLCGRSGSYACVCCDVSLCIANGPADIPDACWTKFHTAAVGELAKLPRVVDKKDKNRRHRALSRGTTTPSTPLLDATTPTTLATETPASAGIAATGDISTPRDGQTPPVQMSGITPVVPRPRARTATASLDAGSPRSPAGHDVSLAELGMNARQARRTASDDASAFSSPVARRHQQHSAGDETPM
jgi:hypothetical protein